MSENKLTTEFHFTAPVEAVLVTEENMEEVAEWCGGRVWNEDSGTPGKSDKYVWVETPKSASLNWAYPGMYVTKRVVISMKGEVKVTWSVFRANYFTRNFFETPIEAVDAVWSRERSSRDAVRNLQDSMNKS